MEDQIKLPSTRKKRNLHPEDYIVNKEPQDENFYSSDNGDKGLRENTSPSLLPKFTNMIETEDCGLPETSNAKDIYTKHSPTRVTNTNSERSKRYQFRDLTNSKNYCEKDEDKEDFSSGSGEEYIPSPEREKGTSSGVSSLGGDSLCIDNILTDCITRTPSTVSNLSFILDSMDQKNSVSIDSKTESDGQYHYTPKKYNTRTSYVDISLKSLKSVCVENESCTVNRTLDFTVRSSPDVESMLKTLTPSRGTDSPISTSTVGADETIPVASSTNNDIHIAVQSSPDVNLVSSEILEKTLTPSRGTDSPISTCNVGADETVPVASSTHNDIHIIVQSSPDKIDDDVVSGEILEKTLTPCRGTDSPTSISNVGNDQSSHIASKRNKDMQVTSHTLPNVNTVSKELMDKTRTSQCSTDSPILTYSEVINATSNVSYDIQVTIEPITDDDDDELLTNKIHASSIKRVNDMLQQDQTKFLETDKSEQIQERPNVQEEMRSGNGNNTDVEVMSTENADNDECEERNDGKQQEMIRIETDEGDRRDESNDEEQQQQSMAKKLTRKRKIDKNEWQDNRNKRLRNSGEAYTGNRTKKQYPKKTMKSSCTCKKMCGQKFTESQRTDIFNTFYSLGSTENQWQYIIRHVKADSVKRITLVRKNNRTQTLKYFFSLSGTELQVCKTFFLHTLSITDQMVYTALEKIKSDNRVTDLRGKHQNRPHKFSSETETSVKTHIEMFPSVESHYTRKETKRQYLSEHLNISKMYRLYKTWYGEEIRDPAKMATKRQYETIFNIQYNYSFYKPKKDQCFVCAKYRLADLSSRAEQEDAYRTHLRRKERVRELKNKEKQTANTDNTTIAIYDLQKVINIPRSEVSVFHYKRKYPVYNFTVFDAIRKKGYCYVWHGNIGKKGCTEVGSCLLQFMKSQLEKGITQILFYSDGCYGQNKNRHIFALYVYAALTLNLDITHKFFVTGHSQNEGDSMHARIENHMKNKVVYTPDQVYGIIMNAKQTGEKYVLKEMDREEILDIKSLVQAKHWKKDTTGAIIRWSDVMEVSITRDDPNCLRFKYDFDEEYSELRITVPPMPQLRGRRSRRGRGRGARQGMPSQQQLIPSEFQFKQAYVDPIPIGRALYTDLKSLCDSGAIPRHYHSFYQSLKAESDNTVSSENRNDPDTSDSESL